MSSPEALKNERLILCEGVEDAQFLRALRDAGRIGAYDIKPVADAGGISGISGFRLALEGLVSVTGFDKVKKC